MKNRLLLIYLLFCFWGSNKCAAQLPECNIIYSTYGMHNIMNYNPDSPLSVTNPSYNYITPPSSGLLGFTVSPVLGPASSTMATFYTTSTTSGGHFYFYLDPSTFVWINTGHKATGGANIGAGGGFIYNLSGGDGKVYRYDGTGDHIYLTTVSGFVDGAPYDLIVDCEGNWYIFNQKGASPFLAQYNSAGTLLKKWVYSNPLGLTVKAAGGFAVIGNKLYTDDIGLGTKGVATYTLGFDTVTLESQKRVDFFDNSDYATCEQSIMFNPLIEIKESNNNICFDTAIKFTRKTLGGGAHPAFQWFVNGSLVSSDTAYSYIPVSGDKVYCVLTSSSPCAVVLTDTSNVILMNTSGPKVVSPVHLCIGGATAPLTAIGTGLKWYTSATGGVGSAIAPTPSTIIADTSTYYVGQSCGASMSETPRSSITVIVHPEPTISLTPSPATSMTLCKHGPLKIKAFNSIAASWQWDSAGVMLSGAIYDSLIINSKGKWGVRLTDIYGCKAYKEVDVIKDTTTMPMLSPTVSSICEEGSVLLTCSPGFSKYKFEWVKDGALISSPTINLWNANLAGNYAAKVTNTLGCVDTSNTVKVTYYPKPIKPIIINLDPVLQIPAAYIHYQWYRNGLKIIGANSNTFVVSAKGSYHIEITDTNGCLNQSDTVFIDVNTGISENDLTPEFEIYPNPAQDNVYIKSPMEISLCVFDCLGKMVLSGKNVKTLSLKNQAAGMYIFKIYDKNNQLLFVHKVYKQ